MHEWQEKFPQASPFFMSVNLSAKQFNHAQLMAQVDGVLRKTGLNPRQLKLEITEGAVTENLPRRNGRSHATGLAQRRFPRGVPHL